MLELKEGDIKKQVADYLEYKQNAGELYYDRLQSGEIIEVRGKTRRRVKLCRAGTADFYILKKETIPTTAGIGIEFARIIFLEIKSKKGKQRPEQGAFQKLVESQGAEYFIVRSVEELEGILK